MDAILREKLNGLFGTVFDRLDADYVRAKAVLDDRDATPWARRGAISELVAAKKRLAALTALMGAVEDAVYGVSAEDIASALLNDEYTFNA